MAEEKTGKQKRRWPRPLRRMLGWVGVQYPRQKGQWVLLTRRFRIIALSAVVAILGGFLFFTFYYSSQPAFCESCHFIQPFVESWRNSSHSMVSCNECHFPPGIKGTVEGKLNGLVELIKTITADHEAPRAEIPDASCLREGCHAKRLLKGEVLLAGRYSFDHTPHLTKLRRGKQLRCTSCHSQIVQGRHISVTESVCFTCHFKGRTHQRVLEPVGGCTSCHDVPAEPVRIAGGGTFEHQPFIDRGVDCWRCHFDSVQGTAEVPRQVCLTCHHDPAKTAKYADSSFVHDWHVTKRKVECFQCHTEIRHALRPEPVDTYDSCATCHSTGHDWHRQMFAGEGGRGVDGSPSPHFQANVDCVACHEAPILNPAEHPGDVPSLIAGEEVCTTCHGDARKGLLAAWKDVSSEMLGQLKDKLTEARQAYEALEEGDPRRREARKPLETAEHDYEFVSSTSAVHNPGYAMDLLDKASGQADQAVRILSRPAENAETAPAEPGEP